MNRKIQQNLTYQNIDDITTALLRKIARNKGTVDTNTIFKGDKNSTTVTVSWVDEQGSLHSKSGTSRKVKGDKFNIHTAKLLALIDAI